VTGLIISAKARFVAGHLISGGATMLRVIALLLVVVLAGIALSAAAPSTIQAAPMLTLCRDRDSECGVGEFQQGAPWVYTTIRGAPAGLLRLQTFNPDGVLVAESQGHVRAGATVHVGSIFIGDIGVVVAEGGVRYVRFSLPPAGRYAVVLANLSVAPHLQVARVEYVITPQTVQEAKDAFRDRPARCEVDLRSGEVAVCDFAFR
jgi:hypothetical protein